MIQSDAAEIAGRLSEFYVVTLGKSSEEALRIQSAVFHLAYEFIPDDAIADQVVLDGDKTPTVLAVDDAQLYLLSAKPKGDDIIPATCRTIRLAPNTDTVKIEAKYWGTGDIGPPREVTWRFDFADDVSVTLETKRSQEGSVSGPEALAKALARAIGWKLPFGDPSVEEGLAHDGY
jgi:hypothetical protein